MYFLPLFRGIQSGGVSPMTQYLGSRTFAVLALLLLVAANPGAAQTGQKGQLHIQKVCPSSTFTGKPGSNCTIKASDLAAVPAATTVYYDEPSLLPEGPVAFLDSKVLLYVGPGDWATGRCTVDFSNAHGLCTFSDGTGPLAGFSARVDVRIDVGTGITYWDGTYEFSPLPPR
jgi:hypothetical protein